MEKILKTMREHAKNKRMYVFWKNRDTISYLKQITKEADAIGKKKKYIWGCVLCALLTAVLIGMIYYYNDVRGQTR